MSGMGQPPEENTRIDQKTFVAILADSLGRGESVWLRVQGVSMLPWLREGAKVHILPVAGRRLHRGDIALFWRTPGHLILHRIVRVSPAEGLYECLGDSENGAPERVFATAMIGVVKTTFFRRTIYLVLNPVRRFINHLCLKWGLHLRHG